MAKKKEEGHETATVAADPHELSSEDFAAQKAALVAENEDAREAVEGDKPVENALEPEVVDDKGSQKKDQQEPDLKQFSFQDEQKPEPKKEPGKAEKEELKTYQIKHKGEIHLVDQERLVALAQKGFDYDKKIGPHQNLVELVESDPEAANLLAGYYRQKYGGKQPGQQFTPPQKSQPKDVKIEMIPYSQFSGKDNADEEWLMANMEKNLPAFLEKYVPQTLEKAAPKQNEPPAVRPEVQMALQTIIAHDAENWQKIVPKFNDYARKLTMEQLDRLERGEPRDILKFYDWVKEQIMPPSVKDNKTPPFRVMSGGGDQKTLSADENKPWEMSRDEFRAEIAKAKGY